MKHKGLIWGFTALVLASFALYGEAEAVVLSGGNNTSGSLPVISGSQDTEFKSTAGKIIVAEETGIKGTPWWEGMTAEEITIDLKGLVKEGNADEAAIKFSQLANEDSIEAKDVLTVWINEVPHSGWSSTEKELGKLFINSYLDTTAFAKPLREMNADGAATIISRAMGGLFYDG